MSTATFVKDRFAIIITAAGTLIATFAWQSAIDSLFKGPCGTEDAGALCHLRKLGPFFFAIILTLLSIFLTFMMARVSEKIALQKAEAQQRREQDFLHQQRLIFT